MFDQIWFTELFNDAATLLDQYRFSWTTSSVNPSILTSWTINAVKSHARNARSNSKSGYWTSRFHWKHSLGVRRVCSDLGKNQSNNTRKGINEENLKAGKSRVKRILSSGQTKRSSWDTEKPKKMRSNAFFYLYFIIQIFNANIIKSASLLSKIKTSSSN